MYKAAMDENSRASTQEVLETLFIVEDEDDIDSIMCQTRTANGHKTFEITKGKPRDTSAEAQLPSKSCESQAEGIHQPKAQSHVKEEDSNGGNTLLEPKATDSKEDSEVFVSVDNRAAQSIEVNVTTLRTEVNPPDKLPVVGQGAEYIQTKSQEKETADVGETNQLSVINTDAILRHKTPTCGDQHAKSKDFLSPGDAHKKVNRLSSDFPDALYEFLYMVQEGRRLNDQRCSFQLEQRRRCYSEPGTPRHSKRVTFSSMTSLQREEFFDLVAVTQSRRLDDQRADPENIQPVPLTTKAQTPSQPQLQPSAPTQASATERKLSIRPSLMRRTVKVSPPKDDLYNMILSSQAQGRLEDQRSRAPGPMDDEDFFSLLLKVQGGRMEEQRTELPVNVK